MNKAISKACAASEALGHKLLASVREMRAGKVARVTQVQVNEVTRARCSAGLSRDEFAAVLQVSRRTLQDWELGRRAPSGPARALIRIALRHPEVLQSVERSIP
jgi:putative transcriptional regulator